MNANNTQAGQYTSLSKYKLVKLQAIVCQKKFSSLSSKNLSNSNPIKDAHKYLKIGFNFPSFLFSRMKRKIVWMIV